MTTDNSYRSLLKYTGILGGTQALNQLTALVRNKLTALLLGPGGLGVLSLFFNAYQLLSGVGELGLSTSGVRELSAEADVEAHQRRVAATVRLWGLVGTLLAGLCCFAAAPALSRYTFGDEASAGRFRLLSVAVMAGVQLMVEQAVLKGIRRLRELALSNLHTTLLSVAVVIPLYYFFREEGVVPAILATALIGLAATVRYSWRYAPPTLPAAPRRLLAAGVPLMKLGLAFMVVSAGNYAANYLIRTFVASEGSLDDVGFFNTGYQICFAYMGIVLTSIGVDYFSRLASLQHDAAAFSSLVNKQIELSLMLIAPLLACLLIGVELAVRILYSEAFLASAAMIVWAWVFVYLRGPNLALGYIALSRGDKRIYLLLELTFCVVLCAACVAGFRLDGIRGLGIALSADAVFELLVQGAVARSRFGLCLAARSVRTFLLFMLMPLGAFALTFMAERGVGYWAVGAPYGAACLWVALRQVRRRMKG